MKPSATVTSGNAQPGRRSSRLRDAAQKTVQMNTEQATTGSTPAAVEPVAKAGTAAVTKDRVVVETETKTSGKEQKQVRFANQQPAEAGKGALADSGTADAGQQAQQAEPVKQSRHQSHHQSNHSRPRLLPGLLPLTFRLNKVFWFWAGQGLVSQS